MSLIFATQLTAVATAALAVFAIVTAFYARQAFRKQSQEVSAIERQVKDQQELTQQQTKLLEIQSGQLDLQRQQFDDQRTAIEDQIRANARQAEVLALQAAELRESLDERKRAAVERRRAQAGRVFISAEPSPEGSDPIDSFLVRIENTSQQPIYHLTFFWRDGTGEWNDPSDPPRHPCLMPGKPHAFVTSLVPSLPRKAFLRDTSLLGAGAVFRDAAGVRWRLRSDGQLDEQPATT